MWNTRIITGKHMPYSLGLVESDYKVLVMFRPTFRDLLKTTLNRDYI